jgi:hypothetical protein
LDLKVQTKEDIEKDKVSKKERKTIAKFIVDR